MMDIVFGLWTDAGAWPDHGGAGVGALGAPVVGPNGLIEILETVRGLGAPGTANVARIAAFQAALERLGGPPRFLTHSLEVDGWATARTVLRWVNSNKGTKRDIGGQLARSFRPGSLRDPSACR